MTTTSSAPTLFRNYLAAAITVVLLSTGISELVNSPSRLAQQQKLDGYGYYVSAGLVSYAKSSLK
ncbi:hypothetical protein [Synechocystis sp. LKSZ1]|uniref:hypothetical protein n=1 Tax=Synechocystis sp. LKSZ1 TaxID=3144951 RepID=UPI00336BF237